MVHVMTLRRKHMVQVLPVAGCGVRPQLPLPVTTAALAGQKLKKILSILLEPLTVIFVLNHFEGL